MRISIDDIGVHIPPKKRDIIELNVKSVKHFTTILNKRDIETREKIYEAEKRMLDHYPDEQFDFSVLSNE